MSEVTQQQKSSTHILVEAGLMVAIAIILNEYVSLKFWTNGGSVTLCSMVPVILVSFRHGKKWGLLTGFVFALLNILLGFSSLKAISGLTLIGSLILDYILAYGVIGLGGIFKGKFKTQTTDIVVGTAFVITIRFICHFLSGILLWGSIVKDGLIPASIYSLTYNGSYMGPELVLSVIVVWFLSKKAPKLLNA